MGEVKFKFNEQVTVPGSNNIGCNRDLPAKIVKDDGGHTVYIRMLSRCTDCDCCEDFRYIKRDKLEKGGPNG